MTQEKATILTDNLIENIRFDLANIKPTSTATRLFRQHVDDLLNERETLLSEVTRLQAALAPFVAKLPDIDGMSGSDIVTLPVLVREVKAARTALVGKAIQ